MPINYAIGPPGTGKTRFIVQEIQRTCRENPTGSSLFLLVPEQASYAMERQLLTRGVAGTTRARVLSFRRLQEWINAQTPGAVRPALNDVHVRALLTRILSEARRSRTSPLLKVNGLERSVTALVKEFEEYQVSADQLQIWAEQTESQNSLLAAKLRELALIASEFQRLTKDRFETAEDSRTRIEQGLQRLDLLQGATMYIDSFDGFGPQEKQLLVRLLPLFRSVSVSLTISPEEFFRARYKSPDPLSLYQPVAETARWFWETFHGEGEPAPKMLEFPRAEPKPVELQSTDSCFCPTLSELRNTFLQDAPTGTLKDKSALILAEVSSPHAEVRQAASQLLAWNRAGWQWGEMGIITRSLSPYAEAIKHELERVGIPFFLDRLEPVENESLLYGLEAIISLFLKGWSLDRFALFTRSRYCTTDLFNRARFLDYLAATQKSESDLFSTKTWQAVPSRDPEGETNTEEELPFELEPLQEELINPYLDWKSTYNSLLSLSANGDTVVFVPGFLKLVVQILAHFPVQTDRDEHLLKQLGGVLQSLFEVCGEEHLSAFVLHDLLNDSLQQVSLPHIPPHLNEVTIGQVDRSRFHGLKGAIILGFNEGQFPLHEGNCTLLTDEERETLEELSGTEDALAPSTRRLLSREQYHAYKAVTRASDCLVVLRPLADWENQQTTPSPYWIELMRLFSLTQSDVATTAPQLLTLEEASSRVAREAKKATSPFVSLKNAPSFFSEPQKTRWNSIQKIAADPNAPHLSTASIRQLFSGDFETSVSQLESFGNCPFQFFAKRTLRPERHFSPTMDVTDLGQYSHALMSRLLRNTRGNEEGFFALPAEEIFALTAAHLEDLKHEYQRKGLLHSALQELQLSALDESVQRWVLATHSLLRELAARHLETEVPFGKKHALQAPPLELRMPDGMIVNLHFRGRMDFRATLTRDSVAGAVLVVDFKLSERRLNWNKALLGRDLQLMLYHFVAANAQGNSADPAGERIAALFVPILSKAKKFSTVSGIASDAFASEFNHFAEAAIQLTSQTPFKLSDSVPQELMQHFNPAVAALFKKIGEEILTGNCSVAPSRIGTETACTYCDLRRACRLDYSMNRGRSSSSRKNQDVMQEWLGGMVI